MPTAEQIAEIQTELNCNHVRKIGEACDEKSGGWWGCSCALLARKRAEAADSSSSPTKEG